MRLSEYAVLAVCGAGACAAAVWLGWHLGLWLGGAL